MSIDYFHSRIKDAQKDLKLLGENISLSGKTCLEIGCGTGGKAFYFSQLSKFVVGIDMSDQVKKNLDYINQMDNTQVNISFAQADGHYLPFASQRFDVVLLHDTMEHISNPDIIISEVARVLSRNGSLSIITPHYYGLSGNHLWNYLDSSIWRYIHFHLIIPDMFLKLLIYTIGRIKNYTDQTIYEEWTQYITLNRLRPKRMRELLENSGFIIEKYSYRRGKLPVQLLWNVEWLEELFSWGIVLVARKK